MGDLYELIGAYNSARAAIVRDERETHRAKVLELPAPKGEAGFVWDRSETIALSNEKCKSCHGLGQTLSKSLNELQPCKCVLRRIFRICLNRFRKVQAETDLESAYLSYGMPTHSGRRSSVWGYKGLEFCSDFIRISARTLTPEEFETFKLHYLLGADYRFCCRRLKLDKGTFFHSIYRISAKLGRTFRELQPYALFPLDEYFGGVKVATRATPKVIEMPARSISSQVPLRRAVAA